jgi:filamentous hemagglutinin
VEPQGTVFDPIAEQLGTVFDPIWEPFSQILGNPGAPQLPQIHFSGSGIGSGATASNPLATGPNEAVFWCGIPGGDTAAASWAAKNGGMTLEMTLDQLGIDMPAWDRSNPISMRAWREASTNFAAGAQGAVTVLQDSSVRVSSVWTQYEYPALIGNRAVTSITAVNPITGESFLIWVR